MGEYVNARQVPLSRTITVNHRKSGGEAIQAVLGNQKKVIGIQDVQKVFTEIIARIGVEKFDVEEYFKKYTTPQKTLDLYQQEMETEFSNSVMTLRELGENIIKKPIINQMFIDLKTGDDSFFVSGDKLEDFMKSIRYSHYTNKDNINGILSNGLNPQFGGGGISKRNMSNIETTKSRIDMSRNFTFVTRNFRDRAHYAPGKEKLDVFIPPEVNLTVDLDSYGYKSDIPLTWIGYGGELNNFAKEGFSKRYDHEYDLDEIQQKYSQICGNSVPQGHVISPLQQSVPISETDENQLDIKEPITKEINIAPEPDSNLSEEEINEAPTESASALEALNNRQEKKQNIFSAGVKYVWDGVKYVCSKLNPWKT